MNLQIIQAMPEQAEELTRIAFAAKAHWGYPKRWLEIWSSQLTFTSKYFEENKRSSPVDESWVAVADETLIGFCTLQEKDRTVWIENLWVLPQYIGKGVGKSLFLHCLELSRQLGSKTLQLEADPNAVGFYEKMGMHKIGEQLYEVEGQPRVLPIMEMKL